MKNFLVIAAFLASTATAHMQLSQPFPIRSPLNKNAKGDKKDYSYTNPLSTSGSDFPCKGYAQDPFEPTANYSPGQSYEIKLAGSATHKGGSCQISLSYDKGKNFNVIHSILGGCPLDKEYKFKVPSDAPKGEALLGWTWFNKVGNREMYMNCAQVTIGGSDKREVAAAEGEDIDDGESGNSTMHTEQATSFKSLPPIFVANVDGPGKCKTVEGTEVNFPKPGPSVKGSLSGKGYKCQSDADFLGSGGASKTEDKDSDKAADTTKSAESTNKDNKKSILETDAHAPAATAAPSKKHAEESGSGWEKPSGNQEKKQSGDNQENKQTDGKQKEQGPASDIECAEDGESFSRSNVNGRTVHMGNVAEGTACRNGKIGYA